MSDVFISYAREDRQLAESMAALLKDHGHSVFWDRRIPAGSTWDEVLERELKEARCVIVLWSRNSVRSKWVRAEAGEAAERSVLIPVLVEEVGLPLQFKLLEAISLLDWNGSPDDPAMQSLLEAVGRLKRGLAIGEAVSASVTRRPEAKPSHRWRRRMGRALIALAVLLVAGTGSYQAYRAAARKGAFTTKVAYLTFLRSCEELSVGDVVTIDGKPVGNITQIDLMPPEVDFYPAYVTFTVNAPYCNYVWSDSQVVARWTPSKQKRVMEVTRGRAGMLTYIFGEVTNLPVAEAIAESQRNEWVLAESVFDGTNLVLVAGRAINVNAASELARLGVSRLQMFSRLRLKKTPTAIWEDKEGKYVPLSAHRGGYWLPANEAPPPSP